MDIAYILTDIEGTTTSISFVVDTLFPYFLDHINELEEALSSPEVQQQLLKVQSTVLAEKKREISDQEALQFLVKWCKEDRKHPALKSLQGLIWKTGYLNGQLKGHIYPEVPSALKNWQESGIQLGVYSSGSVAAQLLLFGHSEAGDLRPLFSHYFDTGVGHKREASSYIAIQEALELPASSILFLSDVEQELDAAKVAGLQTIQLVRPGTKASIEHPTVQNFDQISVKLIQ